MITLFDVVNDLMVLWIVLAIAAIGLVAWLCYRFIPGLRIENSKKDEKQIAKEELDRFLVPMEDEKDKDNVEENDVDVEEEPKKTKKTKKAKKVEAPVEEKKTEEVASKDEK